MPKTNPAAVAVAEREAKATGLRIAGKSYDDIAAELGFSDRSGAHKAVVRRMANLYREEAEELRRLEMARLDRLQAAMWQRAILCDYEAVDRVLKIMARRAKMCGLDLTPDAPVLQQLNEIRVLVQYANGTSWRDQVPQVTEGEEVATPETPALPSNGNGSEPHA